MKSAIISAIVAAIVAGGGSAYATVQLSGLAITKHSIPANRLTPAANKAYTAAPKPRALAASVSSTLDYEQATMPITDFQGVEAEQVSCPSGYVAIAGGYQTTEATGQPTIDERLSDNSGWQVTLSNMSYTGQAPSLTVYVSCQPA